MGPTLLDLAGFQTSARGRVGDFVRRSGRERGVRETQREGRKKARGGLQLYIYAWITLPL